MTASRSGARPPRGGRRGSSGAGRGGGPEPSDRATPTEVVVRGKPHPVRREVEPHSSFWRRYGVVRPTDGHQVSLGFLWFVVVLVALAVDWWMVALVYGVTAGWAGLEAAAAWRHRRRSGANVLVAGVAGAAVGVSGAFGSGALGLALVVAVLAAVAVAAAGTDQGRSSLAEAAGTTIQCAVPPGVAAACVLLTLRLEIGAAVTLVLLVSAYEVGDYLVGTGASTAIEGPVAGIAALGVVAFAIGALGVPPFDGADVATFAALAAVAAPLGQLVGSALLPAADARAPSLRRLDSLLLLAPAWAFAVGLYLQSQT